MLFAQKEKPAESKPVESSSRIKQNYVPFISKTLRFQTSCEKIKKLPNIHMEPRNSQVSQTSKSKDKSVEDNPTQYFFKSDIERFNSNKSLLTPSPVDYYPEKSKKSKEKAKERISPHKMLPALRTIPTIPDVRNKYGYNFEANSHTLVNKTQQQVQKQRTLMKQYQASLTNEKSLEKRMKEQKECLKIKEIEKKVVNLFKENGQKQNKIKENSSLIDSSKPKFHHLYEYHPPSQKQKKILPLNTSQSAQSTLANKILQSKQKFQFFNSSQRRFKTAQSQQPIFKSKISIRQYLSKFIHKVDIS